MVVGNEKWSQLHLDLVPVTFLAGECPMVHHVSGLVIIDVWATTLFCCRCWDVITSGVVAAYPRLV